MMTLDSYKVAPLTMIFLVDGNKVLTLKRNEDKKIYPGKISGFGGKVEPDEDIEASARREFLEEAGLEVEKMDLRGTFIRILDNGYINEMYIFVAQGFKGDPFKMSNEGTIEWQTIEDILNNPDTVDHIPLYLKQVIAGNDFYCGIAEYTQDKRVAYANNKSHFDERR
ncbi:MAG TPA: NUDIX domain-containing protein [Candidatus Saccharimonadales bacterium]|nr:NUDIX domain-containing protein [Candidatus Saccharimonadales bacterium]